MKRFYIVIIFVFCLINSVWADNGTYSSVHINHLKTCTPYTEKYITSVPTAGEGSAVLNLSSEETIVGWSEDKCITTSFVTSKEFGPILKMKCSFSKAQLDSIVEKMNLVNTEKTVAARQALQNELTKFFKDGATCTVVNMMDGKN